MEMRIDHEGISATYQTISNLSTTEITVLTEDKMEQTSRSFITDNRVVDAVRFLEYYMSDQLLGVYRGVGRGNKAEGMFRSGTARITHQKAMRNALEDLNAKIMGDSILLATLHP